MKSYLVLHVATLQQASTQLVSDCMAHAATSSCIPCLDLETSLDTWISLSNKIYILIPDLRKVQLLPHISPGQWDN